MTNKNLYGRELLTGFSGLAAAALSLNIGSAFSGDNVR